MKRIYLAGAALGVIAAAIAASKQAEAAGFALKEQSGSSLGQAFSNASSGTDNISHMFFNPATMAKQEKTQFVIVGNYIAPYSKVTNAFGAYNPTGLTTQSDIAKDNFVPAFYASTPVMEDVVVGIGVNTPFGLVTEYDANWTGNFHAIKSDLKTININPAVAWQVTDNFAIGAGVQIEYIDAELTNMTPLTPLGPLGPVGFAKLTGDDWAFGFNAGMLFEPTDDLKIGVGYRSEIDHTVEGTTNISSAAAAIAFPASADATMPDMITAGLTYDIDEQWSVSGELQYTFWSSFDQLVIVNDLTNTPVSITNEDWDDQIFVAIGGEYRMDDKWTFRAGLAYDETPIPDATRTPRVPGSNRYWLAIGGSYEVNEWFGIDAGYTHIFVDDSEVRITGADPTDAARGPLTADYENGIDIFSLQARFTF